MSDAHVPDPQPYPRRRIARDLILFQAKLWIEGFKDVILVPLSLGAALLDLIFRRSRSRGALHSIMRSGNRFERWIDLYGGLHDMERWHDEHRRASTNTLDLGSDSPASPRPGAWQNGAGQREGSIKK